jgi:flagellar hook-associated protein 3 FlgL
MTRVTENSSLKAINYSMNRAKGKLESLQLKGSNLKRISKPSDDPVGNVQLMQYRTLNKDIRQYKSNAEQAVTNLEFTEQALGDLAEVVSKAKQIALSQSSDIYNPEVRKSVAKEVDQLLKMSLSIANRRKGSKYIFAGYKTLTTPYESTGKYLGDKGRMFVEIGRDFYVPINIYGEEVFDGTKKRNHKLYGTTDDSSIIVPKEIFEPDTDTKKRNNKEDFSKDTSYYERDLASNEVSRGTKGKNTNAAAHNDIFDQLRSLSHALKTNNTDITQVLLEEFDYSTDRIIKLRARVGSIINSVQTTIQSLEKSELMNMEQSSKIEDADVAELFSDLQKQQALLKATYKAGSKLINQSLINFIN